LVVESNAFRASALQGELPQDFLKLPDFQANTFGGGGDGDGGAKGLASRLVTGEGQDPDTGT
jgi:hypothetical protein